MHILTGIAPFRGRVAGLWHGTIGNGFGWVVCLAF